MRQSVALVRRPQGAECRIFFSLDRLSTGERIKWGQHSRLFRFPELKACKTTLLEVTQQKHFLCEFWESCLQNITSLCESTPRLATWLPGQLRNFTYHTATSCHIVKKKVYCSIQVLHSQLLFSENPPFCIHLTDYVNYKGTQYSYGEETSVFDYSAWLTMRHKQCKAFQQRLNHELWMNWRVLSGSRVCFGR